MKRAQLKRTKKGWLVAVAASWLMSPAMVQAELPQKLNRVGRIYGAGWGDGYHACECSGLRPGADLPPKSYSQMYGRSASSHHHNGPIRKSAATFYDLFDSGRRHLSRPSHGHCDSAACDAPTEIYIQGSEVIQTPQVAPSPAHAARSSASPLVPIPPAEQALDNDSQDWIGVMPPSVSDARYPQHVALNGPEVNSPKVATPRPVATAESLSDHNVVADRQASNAAKTAPPTKAAPLAGSDIDNLPPLPARVEAVAVRQITRTFDPPVRKRTGVANTRTPTSITPLHPGNRLTSRSERLIREALGENFAMPTHLMHARSPAVARSSAAAASQAAKPQAETARAEKSTPIAQRQPAAKKQPVIQSPAVLDPPIVAESVPEVIAANPVAQEIADALAAPKTPPQAELAMPAESRMPQYLIQPNPPSITMPEAKAAASRLPNFGSAAQLRSNLRLESPPTVGSMPNAITITMPEPVKTPAADPRTPVRPTELPPSIAASRKRPSRIGQSLARMPRPTRLGGSTKRAIEITLPTSPIQSNPLVGRPVVELAERVPAADSDVIRQPR